MTVEDGVRDPGISRATPVDLTPWAPRYSSQGFLAYLPVDTMHKFESCDLLFQFLSCEKKHKHQMTMPFTFPRQLKAKIKPKIHT